jgi:hypothetical protein
MGSQRPRRKALSRCSQPQIIQHFSDLTFRGQLQWLEEFRYYRREDGLIVKECDDLLSATRYAIMMRRFASPKPEEYMSRPKPKHSGWAS